MVRIQTGTRIILTYLLVVLLSYSIRMRGRDQERLLLNSFHLTIRVVSVSDKPIFKYYTTSAVLVVLSKNISPSDPCKHQEVKHRAIPSP
jgi:hypothetical protein